MSGSGVLTMLLGDYLQQRNRTENLDRAAALLGLAGTNPSPQEVSMIETMGRVDPNYAAVGKDASGEPIWSAEKSLRQTKLEDAWKQNAENVDLLKAAGYARAGGADVDYNQLTNQIAKRRLLERLGSQLTPEQQVAATASTPDIAPVKMSGGVAYNPWDKANPIVGESSAIQALAGLRQAEAGIQPDIGEKNRAQAEQAAATAGLRRAQTEIQPAIGDKASAGAQAYKALSQLRKTQQDTAELRRQAIQTVMENTESGPMLADIANSKTVSKPTRIKVQAADGNSYYVDAVPNLKGGYTYSPANLNEAPLQAPASATQRPTAFASDIQEMLRVYPGMNEQTAAEFIKSDQPNRARILREWKKGQTSPPAGSQAPSPVAPAAPARTAPIQAQTPAVGPAPAPAVKAPPAPRSQAELGEALRQAQALIKAGRLTPEAARQRFAQWGIDLSQQ